MVSTTGAVAASEAQEQSWVATASTGLDPRTIDTLRQISAADRRLLALRAYLRAGDSLAERWSWPQERLSAYPATAEGKAAAADIDTVAAAFAAANPGYVLRVNRKPRSLETQIAHWNQNVSVGAVAGELAAALAKRFPQNHAAPGADDLRTALIDWKPNVAAALAGPGLSAHGQGRAFDFQIERNDRIVAGTEVASARQRWDARGWTQKLQLAMSAAGRHFTGPLQSPYEPWHYAYVPGHGD